jgi:hypothetical protein
MMDEITAEVVGLARFPIVDLVVFLKMALQHQMKKASDWPLRFRQAL